MPTSSIVAGWELGLRLRERRNQRELSVGEAAKAAKIQQPNLSAVEAGKKKITAANLAKLAKLYKIESDECDVLETLRVRADQRDWYHKYTWMLGEEFLRFLGLEAGAVHHRTYQSSTVPGPLQTTEYATAVIKAGMPYVRLTELEPRIEVRQERQQRLFDDDPLNSFVLLSEAAIRQEVGGRDVLRGQLELLAQLATERDNVEIRVIPFSAGAHPALGGPFHTLSFASPRVPDVVFLETLTTFSIIDRPEQVREFGVVLAEAGHRALDVPASIDLIRQIYEELT